MHEKRKKSWAELFNQLPPKQKKNKEPHMSVRDAVKKRDHGMCQMCGREATSLHHIRFRSQGGKNHIENLVSLCSEHHTGQFGPHHSDDLRRFWESWSKQRYPKYWEERERA
jgi:5-methylcytosine-specific restriction endonuclease McrA